MTRNPYTEKWRRAIMHNWMKARLMGALVAIEHASSSVTDQRIIGVKKDLEVARKSLNKAIKNWDAATAKQRERWNRGVYR